VSVIEFSENRYEKIHTRKIEIATFSHGQNEIIVEGKLKDDRLQEIYRPTGEKALPGTVHHMIIRMRVSSPELIIEDISVVMPIVPYKECPKTRSSFEMVKGMRINFGFTARVIDRVGGV
jgi:hypothetical protein